MELALLEDTLGRGESLALDATSSVVYVVRGAVVVQVGSTRTPVAENCAWHGIAPCVLHTEATTTLWRWELHAGAARFPQHVTTLKLRRAIEIPSDRVLMRADRVDFPPDGVAHTHTHQGPGIRVLLCGRFQVQTDGRQIDLEPGDPWFERGPDPVYAAVTGGTPTSFVRVMILPADLRGRSSIRYVNPGDQARPKPQTYTIFVDAPIDISVAQ